MFGFGSADDSHVLAAIVKSQAVIEFDLRGDILSANENFCKAVGYSLGEIVGRHHSMFCTPGTVDSADYEGFWNRLRAGTYDAGTYTRVGKGGREIWIQASYNHTRLTGLLDRCGLELVRPEPPQLSRRAVKALGHRLDHPHQSKASRRSRHRSSHSEKSYVRNIPPSISSARWGLLAAYLSFWAEGTLYWCHASTF
jgi:PAS domain S-box-containing protein